MYCLQHVSAFAFGCSNEQLGLAVHQCSGELQASVAGIQGDQNSPNASNCIHGGDPFDVVWRIHSNSVTCSTVKYEDWRVYSNLVTCKGGGGLLTDLEGVMTKRGAGEGGWGKGGFQEEEEGHAECFDILANFVHTEVLCLTPCCSRCHAAAFVYLSCSPGPTPKLSRPLATSAIAA